MASMYSPDTSFEPNRRPKRITYPTSSLVAVCSRCSNLRQRAIFHACAFSALRLAVQIAPSLISLHNNNFMSIFPFPDNGIRAICSMILQMNSCYSVQKPFCFSGTEDFAHIFIILSIIGKQAIKLFLSAKHRKPTYTLFISCLESFTSAEFTRINPLSFRWKEKGVCISQTPLCVLSALFTLPHFHRRSGRIQRSQRQRCRQGGFRHERHRLLLLPQTAPE